MDKRRTTIEEKRRTTIEEKSPAVLPRSRKPIGELTVGGTTPKSTSNFSYFCFWFPCSQKEKYSSNLF